MSLKKIGILLSVIFSCLIGCRKDSFNNAEPMRETPIEQIKRLYQNLAIDSKFNPNTDAIIYWSPIWDEGIVQKTNDSVEYLFVPVRAYLKENKERIAIERGGKTYLLVKNGKEFYKAFYYTDNNGEIIEIGGFTGKMLLKNLKSGETNLIKYNNGSPYFKDPATILKTSSTQKKMGWEQHCNSREINCTWVIASYGCGPDLQIYHSRDCHWPTFCGSYGWELTDSSEELVCENIWVPDAPETPGGSGNEPESNKQIIDSLQGYDCAQQVLAKLPNLQSKIAIWMKSKFDNFDNNIIFRAVTTMQSDLDGTYNPNNDIGKLHTITLNGNMLLSASQEYIVATMYHEVLHAFLFYEEKRLGEQFTTIYSGVGGMNISGQMKFALEHSEYLPLLDDLAKAIQQFNPNMTYGDALALAKGGVVTNLNTIEDAINKSYKSGTSGTTCTP
ncbi:hypothetical protein [Sphingobacterium deserti]|uniref:SprT-like domain-containing protein n=1 Tax=Sphingobacterium deserti TaxID=1229276 RepID=A0A0B8T488_9SPHI|nr:hypothetical protein [Sphingobacterium deserti]KGE14253.1 hypothetical protein DI53_2083 [Sphingobacterium deserti]